MKNAHLDFSKESFNEKIDIKFFELSYKLSNSYYRLNWKDLNENPKIYSNLINDDDNFAIELKSEVISFFRFLKIESEVSIIEDIEDKLWNDSYKKNVLRIFEHSWLSNFSDKEKVLLFSIFVYKSLRSPLINREIQSINFKNSDLIINEINSYCHKFALFFGDFEFNFYDELSYPSYNIDNKKYIFKIMSYLISKNVIESKLYRSKNKTMNFWGLNGEIKLISETKEIGFSKIKYKIISTSNNKYLKGVFFTKVYECYRENINSKERFQLKDPFYLKSLVDRYVFINNEDLKKIIKIVENHENIKINEIDSLISENHKKLSLNLDKIKESSIICKKNFEKLIYNNMRKEFNYFQSFYSETFDSKDFEKEFFRWKLIDFVYEQIKKADKSLVNVYLTHENEEIIEKEITKTFKQHIKSLIMNKKKDNNASEKYVEKENTDFKDINPYFYDDDANDDFTDKISYEIFGVEFSVITEDKNELKLRKIEELSLFDCLKTLSRSSVQKLIKKRLKNLKSKLKTSIKEKCLNIKLKECNPVKKSVKLSKIFKNLITKLISDEDYINNYYLKKKNINIDLENENKVLQQKISKLYIYSHFNTLLNLNIDDETKIYIPFYFDFRGRLYYESCLGPSLFKFSRYFYNYGYYTQNELWVHDSLDWAKNLINDNIKVIDKVIEHFNIDIEKKYELLKNVVYLKETILWCLIGIGKIGIDKSKIEIKIEEILEKAYNDIINNEVYQDLIDKIEFYHYVNIIKSLNEEKLLKRCILKDATASFIQNLIRLLGYKNENSIKIANLYSKVAWYDTYSFVLNEWKKNIEKDVSSEILKYFTRKTIKKTVMTNPYSAVYLTAFNYFRDEVYDKFNIEVNFNSEIELTFRKFYKFVETEIETDFFLKNPSSTIIGYIEELIKKNSTAVTIETEDSKISLIYFKMKQKTWDIIISLPSSDKNSSEIKIRKTKKYEEIDRLLIDKNKIIQAVRANWVHYLDAVLLRGINRKMHFYTLNMCFLTVHDCFLIDPLNVSNFIDAANKEINEPIFIELGWNKSNNIKFFSIFIFI